MALPLACLLSLLASTALAQSDPYNGRTFTRTPAVGPPGTVIHVSGTGCSYQGQPYQYAHAGLVRRGYSGPYLQYPIKADGSWSGDYVVPSGTPFGDYTLAADCQAADMVFVVPSQPFTVGYAPSPMSTATPRPTRPPTPRPTQTLLASPSPAATPSPSPVALATSVPAPTMPPELGKPSTVPISPRSSALGPTFLIIAAVLACAAVVRRVLVRRRR